MSIMLTLQGKYGIALLAFTTLYLALHGHIAVPYVIKFIRTIRREKRDAALRARWGHARR